MAILHHQPFKGLYLGAAYVQLCAVKIPYWMLRYLFRSWRPRVNWSLARCIFVELARWNTQLRGPVGGIGHMPDYKRLETGRGVEGVWIPPAPEAVFGELKKWADVAGISSVRIPGYWHTKEGAPKLPPGAPPASDSEKVLLFFHGGGYTGLSAHPSIEVNQNATYILKHTHSATRALGVEYRLATAQWNAFPTQIVDAVASYVYLVNTVGFKPENVVVVGDSAGGNLALTLARYCVDYHQQLPSLPTAPGALILLSPWSDLTASHAKGPETSPFANARSDFIGHPTPANPISPSANIYKGKHDVSILMHPYVSPACLDGPVAPSFRGFPRSFILYGDAEVLMYSIVTLGERMKRDLGEEKVVVHVCKDVFHDPIPFRFFEPERTDAARAVGAFIDKL